MASFALAPKPDLIARLKEAGVVVIPSVGAAKHAKKVAGWGADAVIVQGGEGGGHTGPVATTLLLPSVLDAVADTGMPVIAAGGFFDGRGLAAALSYGAAGVAMGTRFLLTSDSTVPDAVKQRYLGVGAGRHRRVHPRRRHAAPRAAHRPGREAGKRFAGTRFHCRGAQCAEVQEDDRHDVAVDDQRRPGDAARQGPHLVAGGDGRQHPDAAARPAWSRATPTPACWPRVRSPASSTICRRARS